MKKHLTLLFVVLLVFMVACNNENASNDSDEEETNQVEEEKHPDDGKTSAEIQEEILEEQENEDDSQDNSEDYDEETGMGYIEDLGHVEVVGVGYNDEVGIDGTDDPLKPVEMGSVLLEIESFAILEIETDVDQRDMFFDGEENVKAIVVDMKVENTSDDDIEFYPNSAIMVTSAGEQVESDMFLMGDAGGEFYGKVKKEGQAWWILENFDEDITAVTMIIDPPYSSEDWEDIADERRLEFEVLNWEDALERDSK